MKSAHYILRRFVPLFLAFAILMISPFVLAQEAEEKSTFIRYVEDTISSDDFQIRLNGLEGTLSSNVSLRSITIADKEGIWITLENPKLVWSRAALLTGRVEIESLSTERIIMPRAPLPNESAPSPEAKPFSLPDLPVSINIEKLEIERIEFGAPVFGLEATASVQGSMGLESGSLDVDLGIKRLDGPGGALKAIVNYAAQSQQVKLDVELREPENGLVANLLNLENTPPVSFSLKGDAPVSELDVDLAFDVDDRRILSGDLKLAKNEDDTIVSAVLAGPLASIMPQQYRPFFGIESNLETRAVVKKSGAVEVQSLSLTSGVLDLDASAQTLADGFLNRLKLKFSMANASGGRVKLPFGEGTISAKSLTTTIDYDAKVDSNWSANIQVAQMSDSKSSVEDISIGASGTVGNITDPSSRSLTFDLSGALDGFSSQDTALAEAVSTRVNLTGRGSWQVGKPLELSDFDMKGETFAVSLAGQVAEMIFKGNANLTANRLEAFSGLAGRNLKGRANIGFNGMAHLLSGGFDLKADGTTRDLSIDQKNIDPLLAGTMTLSGRVARDEKGLNFEQMRLASQAFNTTLQGLYSSNRANINLDAIIKDIADVTPNGSGALSLSATLQGEDQPLNAVVNLELPNGKLQGRNVKKLLLNFDGTLNETDIKGAVTANGALSGKPVKLSGGIDVGEARLVINDLIARVGETRIAGTLSRLASEVFEGELTVKSPDIGDAAALALIDARGAVDGLVKLFPTDDMQAIQANLKLRKVRYQDIRVGSANVVAAVVDVFGKPKVGATIDGTTIQVASNTITNLSATAQTTGETTRFEIDAALVRNNARIKANGSMRQRATISEIYLERFTANTDIANVRLQSPTTVSLSKGTVLLSAFSLAVGSGNIAISGSAGKNLDLDVRLRALPLSIANAIQPSLQAGGVLSGQARVSGTPDNPNVSFNLDGNGLTAAQVAQAGITPFGANVRGAFSNDVVSLESARVTNRQGISVQASGRIPLKGNGLNIRASGNAPLSLAAPTLASRGATVTGQARFDMAINGSISNLQPNGLLSIENASFTDPLSNLKLTNIGLLAGLSADRVTINRGSAKLSSGGSISLSGNVGLSGDLPANISIVLSNARYTDGQTFNTRASGRLTVTRGLLRNPLLGGNVTLERTEITVPESVGSNSDLLDVKHINPSAQVRQTLNRLERASPKGSSASPPSVLSLNLTIDAPNQIFVRGRGLDAELGGRVRVTGPLTNVSPQGRFELRRGRLSILGQRIDLTEGSISLTGDLNPFIDLTAKTRGGDVDAFINVRGRTSDIKVTFSSSPELPQDEVLARIIFGRGITDLSPAQIARLASVAAELTGGSSPGLVSSIRSSSGLDDLDVVQDEDGNAAVKAGKYINDNVYLGVQAGAKSEATINLDITDGVTARGAVDSDGEASIGIFLEKDY